ncbi:energy transducer TonB [Bacteroides sp. 519]|uniref:energy transducer TonB n=1 Tax=Bacteroides sp. 519 TaxID=2302937 RepID=UPI0013D5B5ED|nr:energy transducer TonB [Bacteroides sp. 519]NDV60485.1 energy transducer TonB [Bacteroides sp. 519]
MERFCLIIIMALTSLYCKSQTIDSTYIESDTIVYEIVEQMPEFPGGTACFMSYLSKNIKLSSISQEDVVHGRFIARFIVEKDGSITGVYVIRSLGVIDDEYLRVIREMPKWEPGMKDGKPVRVWYTLPVHIDFR